MDTVLRLFAQRGRAGRCCRGRHLLQYHILDIRLFAHEHYGINRRTAEQHDHLRLHFCVGFQRLQIGVPLSAGPLIAVAIRLGSVTPPPQTRLYSHIRHLVGSRGADEFRHSRLSARLGSIAPALALQAAINAINVCMVLFLVLRLHRGVAGIATATALAEWVGCLFGLGVGARCGAASRQASAEFGRIAARAHSSPFIRTGTPVIFCCAR